MAKHPSGCVPIFIQNLFIQTYHSFEEMADRGCAESLNISTAENIASTKQADTSDTYDQYTDLGVSIFTFGKAIGKTCGECPYRKLC